MNQFATFTWNTTKQGQSIEGASVTASFHPCLQLFCPSVGVSSCWQVGTQPWGLQKQGGNGRLKGDKRNIGCKAVERGWWIRKGL